MAAPPDNSPFWPSPGSGVTRADRDNETDLDLNKLTAQNNTDPEPDQRDPEAWLAWKRRQVDKRSDPAAIEAERQRRQVEEQVRQRTVATQQTNEDTAWMDRYGGLPDDVKKDYLNEVAPLPPPTPKTPQNIVHPPPTNLGGVQAPEGMRPNVQHNTHFLTNAGQVQKGDGGSPRPSAPSGSVSVSAQGPIGGLAPIMRDYDEQLAGMSAEKDARAKTNEAVSGQYGQAADEQRGLAQEQFAHQQEDNTNARRHLDEIGLLVQDYAQQKIDPMKWYHDATVPQKIASVVGAMFAGWQGGPKGAQEYINAQTDRSIALQQEQLHRGAEAIGAAQNLYSSFLRTSENEQQAYDKTRAAMLSSAMLDVQKTATAAKTDEEKAQIDQLMAGLKLQRDMLLARIQAQLAGKGAATSQNGLEVDPKSIATGTNGQQYLITNPAFSDDISLNLAQFGRLRDSLQAGQSVLDERKGGWDWALPYSDNIQRGEAVKGAIKETASKLASARGMPAGLEHVVQDLVPQFDSRFAGATGAAKIPEVLKLLDQYEQEYLHAAGAYPSQITMGPGLGKEAGKLKYFAKPGVVTVAKSQTGAASNPLLKSFQPGP